MDAVKAILMGCGALALLSVVGCVGLTSAGYYAIDQAIEQEQARQDAAAPAKRAGRPHASDPFSDYQSESYDEEEGGYGDGGWGDEAR